MDAFGNILKDGLNGQTVEIDHDQVGFWARTDKRLVAGPFANETNARVWLANPQFRENHPTDRFGINLWCVRISQTT